MDVDRRDFLKASTAGAFAGQLAVSPLFPGFATRKVETSGATINVVHGGSRIERSPNCSRSFQPRSARPMLA